MGALRGRALISTSARLSLLVPGPLDQRTGGYLYDARIVEELRARGWIVSVHTLEGRFPDPDGSAVDSMRAGLAAIPEGSRVVLDGLALPALAAECPSHTPSIEPGRSIRPGRARTIALVHHPVSEETGLDPDTRDRLRGLERAAVAMCAGVVVTSPFTAGRVREYLEIPADRIRVVVPGTDRPPLRSPVGSRNTSPPTGASHRGQGAVPRLLCVGSVVPRKGQDLLVDALTRLASLPWSCVVAGSLDRDPSYARSVLDQVTRAGLGDRVRFVGEVARTELDTWYGSSTLFILPSHYEGYGMALAEAITHGLPVVSTTGGAIPGTVPARAGILVPPGDAGALARALERLLRNPGERERLAAGARRRANTLPSWRTAGERFASALLELCPSAPSDP